MRDSRIRRMAKYKFAVMSDSDPSVEYLVEKRGQAWICECKGFRLTCLKNNTDCKHIRWVRITYSELDDEPPEHQHVRIVNALGEVIRA